MAALTTSRDTREKRGEVFDFDVKANTTIHQGSLVVLDAGYAAPGAAAAGLIAVGRAEESAARLTAAPLKIRVRRGIFGFANAPGSLITQADVGKDCYVIDDQTVGRAGSSRAGIITAIDGGTVWVQIGLGL